MAVVKTMFKAKKEKRNDAFIIEYAEKCKQRTMRMIDSYNKKFKKIK